MKYSTKKTKPCEARLLRIFDKKPIGSLFAFMNLRDEDGRSRPSVSKDLKSLQKKGFVLRDIDNPRKYKLTLEGKKELNKIEGIEKVESLSFPFSAAADTKVPIDAEYWSSPYIGKDIRITGHMSIDDTSPIELAEVVEKLGEEKAFESVVGFFRKIGEVLAEKKGVKLSFDPIQDYYSSELQKVVKYEQALIGFNASVLLNFNGAEVSKKIKWEEELKKAAIEEKMMQDLRSSLKSSFRDETFRKHWLAENILKTAVMFKSVLFARSEKDVEELLIELISHKFEGIIEESMKPDIRVIFDEIKATGLIKIIPSYSLEIENGLIYDHRGQLKRNDSLSP
jgi:DNA-binding MarR family transcriptional regulator